MTKIIAVEGPDCVGKSTFINNRLQVNHNDCVIVWGHKFVTPDELYLKSRTQYNGYKIYVGFVESQMYLSLDTGNILSLQAILRITSDTVWCDRDPNITSYVHNYLRFTPQPINMDWARICKHQLIMLSSEKAEARFRQNLEAQLLSCDEYKALEKLYKLLPTHELETVFGYNSVEHYKT